MKAVTVIRPSYGDVVSERMAVRRECGMPSEREHKSIPAATFGVLRAYLEARANFSEDDFDIVRSVFLFKPLPAGEFLQRGGDVTRYAAFVASGCLRSYVIDAKGKEHIVQFAPETWWLADSTSLAGRSPSQYFIDAIEDSELLLIDSPSHQHLVERVHGYATAFRNGLQRHAVPPRLPHHRAPGAPVDARVLPWHDAGDDQPYPPQAVSQVVRQGVSQLASVSLRETQDVVSRSHSSNRPQPAN
jgi:cyclic nucleotide-binding protein